MTRKDKDFSGEASIWGQGSRCISSPLAKSQKSVCFPVPPAASILPHVMAISEQGQADVQDHRPMLFDQIRKRLLVVSELNMLQESAVTGWIVKSNELSEMRQHQTQLCLCHVANSSVKLFPLNMPPEASIIEGLGNSRHLSSKAKRLGRAAVR